MGSGPIGLDALVEYTVKNKLLRSRRCERMGETNSDADLVDGRIIIVRVAIPSGE